MRIRIAITAACALLLAACGPKWQETEADGFKLVTQKGGAALGYTSAPLLTVDRYAFKDLNRNGTLDPYEDWRLPAETRAKDLAAQLSIEEIAGLML
jgi:beta-glucosidase